MEREATWEKVRKGEGEVKIGYNSLRQSDRGCGTEGG